MWRRGTRRRPAAGGWQERVSRGGTWMKNACFHYVFHNLMTCTACGFPCTEDDGGAVGPLSSRPGSLTRHPWEGARTRPPRRELSNDWKTFFQWLEKCLSALPIGRQGPMVERALRAIGKAHPRRQTDTPRSHRGRDARAPSMAPPPSIPSITRLRSGRTASFHFSLFTCHSKLASWLAKRPGNVAG